MGEAKRRQYNREEFLKTHTRCVYCGGHAETVDHCPPRCFFVERVWPETFEYPSCVPCNTKARLDEQALAVMVRVRALQPNYSSQELVEYEQLMKGVHNNQPELLREWTSKRATERKTSLRKAFGREKGDNLRFNGWGVMHLGPLSAALIQRFMIRLGQSMFYNHVGRLFQGTVYTRHASLLQIEDAEGYLKAALSIAPMTGELRRSGKRLDDQFSYWFNVSPEHDIFYAVVRFSEQFVFQITAMGPEMATRFSAKDMPPEAVGVKTEITFGLPPA